MTEQRSKGSLVRYYCTAGNGMEAFLMDEVKTKLAAENVCHIPGKVLFSSSAKINRVSNLKAAERLFLLLKQDSPVNLSAHTNAAKAASVLQSRLLDDKNQWTSAVMTWSRLQGELAGSKTTVRASSSSLGLTRERDSEVKGSEEQRKEEKKNLVEPKISTGGERKENIGRQRISEQNGVLTMAQKRKREEEEDRERKAAAWDTNIEKIVEERIDDKAKDFSEESQERVKPSGERNEMPMKTCKDKPQLLSCDPVSFRISCKCSGSLSRCLSTQEVSRVIGTGLSRMLGWKADLRNSQLEINVHLSDDYCLLGIPLTRLPLANRGYIKITGLRSTTAWAMASLAHIQPGFCVVDPMCGVGTILIEAAQEHKDSCFLGVDIDEEQLQKASENIGFGELGNRIHLLKASSLALPLPSASVDAVICDLPFGKKFGSRIDMATNLPLILTEMERVLRPGGILVLLLSPLLSCLLKKLLIQKDTGPTSNPETKPQTGMQNCLSPSVSPSKKQTFQILPGVESSPSQETKPLHSLPLALSSMKHQETFRVSLGAIDGLIHKYVKTDC